MKLTCLKVGVVAVVSDLSITIHLTLYLSFLCYLPIRLFNEHYDSDDLLMFIHDNIGRTNSLKVSQLREA